MNQGYKEEKNPTSEYWRAWTRRPKQKLAITFWAKIFKISFEDLVLIFYIHVPNTTTEGAMKKNPTKHLTK